MNFYYDNKCMNLLRTPASFLITLVTSSILAYMLYSRGSNEALESLGWLMYFISFTTGFGFSMCCMYGMNMDLSSIGPVQSKPALTKAMMVGAYISVFSGVLSHFILNIAYDYDAVWLPLASYIPFAVGISIGVSVGRIAYRLYLRSESVNI